MVAKKALAVAVALDQYEVVRGVSYDSGRHEEALVIYDSVLLYDKALLLQSGDYNPRSNMSLLGLQANRASCLSKLGRHEECLTTLREVYASWKTIEETNPRAARDVLLMALNLASALMDLNIGLFSEAKALCSETHTKSRRLLGEEDDVTLGLRYSYAKSLVYNPAASLEELRLGVAVLEKIKRTALRVFGPSHPRVSGVRETLREARRLSERDAEPSHAA